MGAAQTGNVNLIRQLIAAGADVKAANNVRFPHSLIPESNT
jgi:hypothetical protein